MGSLDIEPGRTGPGRSYDQDAALRDDYASRRADTFLRGSTANEAMQTKTENKSLGPLDHVVQSILAAAERLAQHENRLSQHSNRIFGPTPEEADYDENRKVAAAPEHAMARIGYALELLENATYRLGHAVERATTLA